MLTLLKKLLGFELPSSTEPRRNPPEGWHDDGSLPPVEDWECFDERFVTPRRIKPRIKDLHGELEKEKENA
jgi:hypothetical protein